METIRLVDRIIHQQIEGTAGDDLPPSLVCSGQQTVAFSWPISVETLMSRR